MGSRRSVSGLGDLPFGYLTPLNPSDSAPEVLIPPTFDYFSGTQRPPPPPPGPAPAPGPPLLETSETSRIANALNTILTDHNNYGQLNFGEGFTNDGLDLPPALEGVSTSFGLSLNGLNDIFTNGLFMDRGHGNMAAPTNSMNGSGPMSASMAPPTLMHGSVDPGLDNGLISSPDLMHFPSSIANQSPSFAAPQPLFAAAQLTPPSHATDRAQYSPDVVEAATVLHRSHNMSHQPPESRQQPLNRARAPPSRQIRYQGIEEFQDEGRRMSQSASQSSDAWMPFVFGDNEERRPVRARPAVPLDLQYGTDQSFGNNNRPFEPRLRQDTSAALQEKQMSYMSAIDLSTSTNTTPGPDVTVNGNANPRSQVHLRTLSLDTNGQDDPSFRKSRSREDEGDDEDEPQSAASKTSARKRKLKTEASGSPATGTGTTAPNKRRKSAAAAKRENLTEDQKRENHINSEKKRRKVISVGFDNLGHIVPAANGGNTSKSAVLEATVAFIQELMEGNAQLRQMHLLE
ncbi:hypothetical protein BD289DRAFT_480975 [Coniella lustricola]|uniref:BHLH domain-containing protein n=1 Tax=Coniella lustricola TaxID=2025994 RepID=A0A2T3ADS9_9PEZI|nr:hypothetical protein BD289DRAFT_480975 [Coniella lustricola]